ncbi:MAG: enoyl-CoA hydratase/isomerase family protein [Bdellovibrionales bacterium]|nr:enoyl-CoA hydratase/isomerase family protein [Bdellovibrionales bacterium]
MAVILRDTPGSALNVLSTSWGRELAEILRQARRDPSIQACVIASAKAECFIAGADLGELARVRMASEARDLSQGAQKLLDSIEGSPIPIVAAIHGVALGGGAELILACHGRVASSDPATVIAFPEAQLGLLPGAGGTQRLPRLIGLRESLALLLGGTRVRGARALALGLIDELVAPEALIEAAARRALLLSKRSPGAAPRPRSRAPLLDRLLTAWPIREILLRQARAQVLRKTRGNYPAPLLILDAVAAGPAREAEHFGALVVSPEARNLIWIFHATQELKKAGGQGRGQATGVTRLGVLGAGLMGEGITSVSLPLSEVVLKDLSEESIAKAKANLEKAFDRRVRSGAMRSADRDRDLGRLKCGGADSSFAGCELVVEAVFENRELKRKVLAQAEAQLEDTAVFASNTSALPIAEIAAGARRPERVLGMHYFSPVPKMPLLEIIVTPETSARALELARAFGVAQGKTVIVVKDGPGFYTTRILAPLLNEAVILLKEGHTIERVDGALKDYGFPLGPIALLDEVGIDVGAHVARDLGRAFGARWGEPTDELGRMVAAGFKGKKAGKGFYDYSGKKGQRRVNPRAYEYFGSARSKALSSERIAERVAWRMISEAIHCLEEGVIECPRDGDIGAILGLGFPPFRGGPFHAVDRMGAGAAQERLVELAAAWGPRFKPPHRLGAMAERNESFYEIRLPH